MNVVGDGGQHQYWLNHLFTEQGLIGFGFCLIPTLSNWTYNCYCWGREKILVFSLRMNVVGVVGGSICRQPYWLNLVASAFVWLRPCQLIGPINTLGTDILAWEENHIGLTCPVISFYTLFIGIMPSNVSTLSWTWLTKEYGFRNV